MIGTIVLTLLTIFRIVLPVLLLFLLGELVRRSAEKQAHRKGSL
jgi:hypothetical protein